MARCGRQSVRLASEVQLALRAAALDRRDFGIAEYFYAVQRGQINHDAVVRDALMRVPAAAGSEVKKMSICLYVRY